MVIAAAAGISYIFNDDEHSTKTKHDTVTASSTIIDQQGILKYVIYPRYSYRPLINEEQRSMGSMLKKYKTNQFEVPIENKKRISHFKQEFSVVFYWSIPLKARLLQMPTKSSLIIENLNPFQHYSMKISIGTQNEINENLSSEIALSNSDNTLDSLSYNPIQNNHLIPIGILKKKKLDLNERDTNEKRFCFDKELNEENRTRNMILKNVNLCVENLSKILSESCSNTEELFQSEEDLKCDQFYLTNTRDQLSDGVILHRGEQFGIALGEPMIRKSNETHSINELDRLFSKMNCLLMQEYQIETIEDLIRLFLKHGQDQFIELMINRFKVNPFIVEQVNLVLHQWAKQFKHF